MPCEYLNKNLSVFKENGPLIRGDDERNASQKYSITYTQPGFERALFLVAEAALEDFVATVRERELALERPENLLVGREPPVAQERCGEEHLGED